MKTSPLTTEDPITLTLYDNGGMDTLDLRTDSTGQRVDLRPEGISDVYGLTGNLVIARDTLIENLVAGSGNDTITDFNDGDDNIDLTAFEDITSFNDLSLEQQGDDVVIDLSEQGGGTIVLSDFVLANLDASDFVL